jgi:hypothetical protein
MTINYLPGQPNNGIESCSFVNWNTIQILAYTSGNNLVILTKNSTHLQTIYLPEDSFVVDINKVNGKIAIAIKNQVYVYTPEISNFYNFNFHGRRNLNELKIEWVLEHVITNKYDDSTINTLSWSDHTEISDSDSDSQFKDLPLEFNSKTTCELITGSNKSLTMHQLFYVNESGERKVKCSLLWYKEQPNPIYKVKISPNATCIASIGYYDRNVKLWHRVGFTSEFCDFELHYLLHDTYVTDIVWKSYMVPPDSNKSNSASNSATITPSSSFILKPANSIIKNDTKLLSDTSSNYSFLKNENQHNILYTFTENSILSVHSMFRLDKGFTIFQSGSLDLFENDPAKRELGVFKSVAMIDNPYLELGLEKMLSHLKIEANSTALNYSLKQQNKLLNFIKSKIELCMIIGSDGELTLYGLENLCNSSPTNMTVCKINEIKINDRSYHAEIGLSKYCLPSIPKSFFLKSIQVNHYSDELALTLVLHDCFRNTIREIGFSFDDLFQFEKSKPVRENFHRKHHLSIGYLQQKFTGHNKSVRKLIRSGDGSSILSVTRFNENYLWTPIFLSKKRTTLTKKSIIVTPSPVLAALIWKNGEYVFTIVQNKLLAYYCFNSEGNNKNAAEVCSYDIHIEGNDPGCAFLLPETALDECHIILVAKDGVCKSYEFKILKNQSGQKSYRFAECLIENLKIDETNDLHIISAIDPVGWNKSIDRFGRAVLSTISTSGVVSIYYVTFSRDNGKDEIKWHLKERFRTGINNCSFLSCSSINKMAIVDQLRTKLSIWDMELGVSEYFEEFENEIIKDLDWTSTKNEQGILAVGFKLHSILFTQLRYDYTNRTPSFAKIKKIEISDETTHEIGDSIWMKDGILAIGAGNQLYLSDKSLDVNNDIITNQAIGTLEIMSNDLFHLCSALNGPLPLYHPQFIIQLLLSDRSPLIRKILVRLSKVLREIDLGTRKENDFELDISIDEVMSDENKKNDKGTKNYPTPLSSQINFTEDSLDEETDVFNEQCVDILIEKLQKLRLPFLSGHQQITLSHTISIMKDILLKYLKVLDFNGLKFYLTVKLFTLNITKEISTLKSIRMRDVTFALHSDNKDLLYDIVNEQSKMKIDWLNAKRYMLPFWLDSKKLRSVIEKIAANEFLKYQNENDGKKDPSSCSIFYLMLKKKQVLLGLWKNSIGHNERNKMVKFLSNDFTEQRWRSAAMKNAYVLLGKHRYMDAASFFLLADAPKDAVNVIVRQLRDIPLAIAVARCYEGSDSGPSMISILERQVVTEAINTNDKWKLSWIFWILGQKPLAAQSLIKPLHAIKEDISKVLPNYKWPNLQNVVRTSNTEDPVLLVMYNSLRNRNVEYYKGTSQVKPEHEFSFVIKAAAMYTKMGCDWLALYIVKKWEFSEKLLDVNSINEMLITGQTNRGQETQRKKPGDILAKFMSSDSKSSRPKAQDNNLLASFATPKATLNMLDSFGAPESVPNLLDSFAVAKDSGKKEKSKSNLLSDTSSNTQAAAKSNNLLDEYTTSISKQPVGKKILAAPSTVPNMLDNWS